MEGTKKEKEKRDPLSELNHNLRGPLGVISLRTSILRRLPGLTGLQEKQLDAIDAVMRKIDDVLQKACDAAPPAQATPLREAPHGSLAAAGPPA